MANPKRYSEKVNRKDDEKKSGFQIPLGSYNMMDNLSIIKPLFKPHFKSIFQSGGVEIHAKMEVSQPGNHSEMQADEVAESFMSGDSEHSQNILSQPTSEVSRDSEGDAMLTSDEFDEQVEKMQGGGMMIPDEKRASLEEHMGADLDEVRLHIGPEAKELSESINARAFTLGNDIFFADDYNDDELLAHEVTHTVQNNSGINSKIKRQSSNYNLPPNLSLAITFNQKNNEFDIDFIRRMYYIGGNRRLYDAAVSAKKIDFAYTLLAEELQETLIANGIKMPYDGMVGKLTKGGMDTWVKNAGDYNSKIANVKLDQTLIDKLVLAGGDPFPGQLALFSNDVTNSYFAYFVASLQHLFFTEKKEYTGKLTPALMQAIDAKVKTIKEDEQNKKALEEKNKYTKKIDVDKTATTGIKQRNDPKIKEYLSTWKYYNKVNADWGDSFEFSFEAIEGVKLLVVTISYTGQEKGAQVDPPLTFSFHLDSDKMPDPYFAFHKAPDPSSVNRFLYIDPYGDNKTVFAITHVMDKNKNYAPPWRDHLFQFATLGEEIWDLKHIVVRPENSIPIALKAGKKMEGGFVATAKANSETQLHSWQALTNAKVQLDNLLAQTNFYAVDGNKTEWKSLSTTVNAALALAEKNKDDDSSSPNGTALASMITNVEPSLKKMRVIAIPSLYPSDISADIIAMVEETKAKYELAIIQSYSNLEVANATLGEADNLAKTLPSRITNQMLQQNKGMAPQIQQMDDLAGNIRMLRDARSNPGYRYIYSYLGITGKPTVTPEGKTQNSALTADFESGLQGLRLHNEKGAIDTYLGSMMLMEDLHTTMGLMTLVSMYEVFSLDVEISDSIFVSPANKLLIYTYQQQFNLIIKAIETEHQKAVAKGLTLDQWHVIESTYLQKFYSLVNSDTYKADVKKIDDALQSSARYKKIASLVLTVIAALTAEFGGELILTELELWGVSEAVTGAGASLFAAEVLVFTGEMYVGETAMGEKVDFMDMLIQNTMTFGILKGVSAANEAIFRAFGGTLEYKTLMGVTSTGAALITLEGIAELQTRAATGEWMTKDQAMQTLVENIAITIGVVMGKFVANKFLPNLIVSNGRYARQIEAIQKTRGDINQLYRKILSSENPGKHPQLSLLLTEIQNTFNQETTLIELAREDKVLDPKQALTELASYQKVIADMEFFLAQAGVELQTSSARYFWAAGPGEIAYNEKGVIQNQPIAEWLKANFKDGFKDLGNGIFVVTKGAEVITYIPGSQASMQRRVEIERKKFNGDDNAVLISLRKRLYDNAAKGLDIFRGENETAKDFLDRLDAMEKEGKDLNIELGKVFDEESKKQSKERSDKAYTVLQENGFTTRPDTVTLIENANSGDKKTKAKFKDRLLKNISEFLRIAQLKSKFVGDVFTFYDGAKIMKAQKNAKGEYYKTRQEWLTDNPGKEIGEVQEVNGKIYKSIAEIDAMVTEMVDGKQVIREVDEVKSGKNQTAQSAQEQIETKAIPGMKRVANGEQDVEIIYFGKIITTQIDASTMPSATKQTVGGIGKEGFQTDFGLTLTELGDLADRIILEGGKK